ncbi:MAG: 7-cyano-7-deazaguanine synthase [Planctomycetota bacterium]
MADARSKVDDQGWKTQPLAVLVSGGLDSAVLLADLAITAPKVVPIRVRFGLVWEEEEEKFLRRFLGALANPSVADLVVFEMPIHSVYGPHWSTTGERIPGYDSPDEAVFLPGRNPLLLVQAMVWCHLQGVRTIALGPLASNPFPDSTDDFFDSFERSLNLALEGKMHIKRPYARLSKREVLRRGASFPLQYTLSCIHPREGKHCGDCNKCHERQASFRDAGLADPTEYALRIVGYPPSGMPRIWGFARWEFARAGFRGNSAWARSVFCTLSGLPERLQEK